MASISTSLKSSFSKLPPAAQIILFVLFLAAIYLMFKAITAKIKAFGNSSNVKAEIQAYESAGYAPSYTPSQYNTMAKQIYEAVAGNGTNTTAVVSVFEQMQTDLDVLYLETEYMKVEQDSDFTSLGQRLQYESEGWGGFSWGADSTVDDVNSVLASKGLMRRY